MRGNVNNPGAIVRTWFVVLVAKKEGFYPPYLCSIIFFAVFVFRLSMPRRVVMT